MKHAFALRRPRPRLLVAVVAILVAAGALALATAMRVVTGTFAYSLQLLAVVISAAFGGTFGALVAIVTTVALTPLLVPPFLIWTMNTDDALRLGVQVIAGLLVGIIVSRQRRAAEVLQSVVNSTQEGVIVTDPEGAVVYLNAPATMLTGWTFAQARGRALTEVLKVIDETSKQPLDDVLQFTPDQRAIVDLPRDTALLNRDGVERAIDGSASVALDDRNVVIGAIVVFRDDSTRRRTERELREAHEQAERANVEKDHFVARVSHELRSPLNAIVGWARMLRDGQIPTHKTAQAFAAIDSNGEVLTKLVDDLIDMSRVATGKLQLDRQPLDINAVVREAVTLLEPAANAKNIVVKAEIESESLTVDGDAPRLRQVLWNLLSNAVKFTPTGGRIMLRLRRVDEDVEISVVDTGGGIAPEFLPRVFEPFSQAEEGKQGLGLGLAIAQQLVDAHQGRISATSEGIGAGATFTVRLPLMRMPGAA